MEEGGRGGFEGETPTVLVATSNNNTFPTPFHKNPEHYKLETPVSDRNLKTFSNSNTSILRPLVITAQKVKIKTRVDVQCVMQYIQKFPSDLKPVPKKRMLYMNSPKRLQEFSANSSKDSSEGKSVAQNQSPQSCSPWASWPPTSI